ncbi:hypothetical protein [Mesonia aestuariivivens]|uniref:Uncharacterized protein n=1 Tax=Mesonia aestuariivivens TaxID=2796128 RepID=A0ABS6W1F4_9FLAO|nr:hypothetical protein [Mesonia aestuariivivens]MBW2961564.1 hypothetical protein [Mesonia aestuariivivens]
MNKRFFFIIFFLFFKCGYAQNNLKELRGKYSQDTLYIYTAGVQSQTNITQSKGRKVLGEYDYWVTFHFKENVFFDKDFIAFIKSRYQDASLKIPDRKLIDPDWIAKNQDKILVPRAFPKI